jgi:hypothetical protein
METETASEGWREPGSFIRPLIRFFLNLVAVYLLAEFVVMWLAGVFHNSILPLLKMPSGESLFAFAFNHLLLFSLLCGMSAGIVAAKYNYRAAQWVWVVPTLILTFKFATFPSSLFESRLSVAFHHFVAGGFLIPNFHNYSEMFAGWSSDYAKGIDQVRFTAPVYVSLGYGFAAWAGGRLGLRIPGPEALVAAQLPVSETKHGHEGTV